MLDDAEITVEPSSSSETLDAARDGAVITITGSVEPGETATVEYVATVRADGERGDDLAANFLMDPGETVPEDPFAAQCDGAQTDCTHTPIAPAPDPEPSPGPDPSPSPEPAPSLDPTPGPDEDPNDIAPSGGDMAAPIIGTALVLLFGGSVIVLMRRRATRQ